MIYSFQTVDDERFFVDTQTMRWSRASSILSAPSISAVENSISNTVPIESGNLISMGGGAFNLDGRTPKTTGPGAGLSSIGILAVPYEDTLVMYLHANVPVKDESFTSNPIKHFKYVIAQAPQEPEAPKVELSDSIPPAPTATVSEN